METIIPEVSEDFYIKHEDDFVYLIHPTFNTKRKSKYHEIKPLTVDASQYQEVFKYYTKINVRRLLKKPAI